MTELSSITFCKSFFRYLTSFISHYIKRRTNRITSHLIKCRCRSQSHFKRIHILNSGNLMLHCNDALLCWRWCRRSNRWRQVKMLNRLNLKESKFSIRKIDRILTYLNPQLKLKEHFCKKRRRRKWVNWELWGWCVAVAVAVADANGMRWDDMKRKLNVCQSEEVKQMYWNWTIETFFHLSFYLFSLYNIHIIHIMY